MVGDYVLMLNFKTLRACRESANLTKNSEYVDRRHWKANKAETLVGTIAYFQATPGSGGYSSENDRDPNSLQARYMKGMRPGGVFR